MSISNIRLFLVAPNVSAQMGGEAIKALQIFEQLNGLIGDVTQITHTRNKAELETHRLAAKISIWKMIGLTCFFGAAWPFVLL